MSRVHLEYVVELVRVFNVYLFAVVKGGKMQDAGYMIWFCDSYH